MKNRFKQLVTVYISFIAVIITVVTVIWSTYEFKNDLEFTTVLLGVAASLAGGMLSILFLRATTRKYRDKIFISYSYHDKKVADDLRERLKSERFILNIDEENVLVGENIKEVINKELESSSIIIVLLSKHSSKSDFVNFEIKKAIESEKKVLPVIIDESVEIPELLDRKSVV